ncbi:MAG: hypothetical protein Q9174_002665 [Haloplaca sp. 1 TL-2023]
MAEVYLPHQPFMPSMNSVPHDRLDSDIPNSRSFAPPLPNPHFVFPMQVGPSSGPDDTTTASTSENAGNRRSKPRSRPQQLSFSTLPDFEFHPSPPATETSPSVTPSSPTKSRAIPPHGGGHRRNGSEFIGGDGKNGFSGLMSTSPTKGEGSLPLPPGARSGPPAGRRGHAHRRSGAISSHDLSNILRPASEARGGSAPSTPSDPLVQPTLPPMPDRSTSQPMISSTAQDTPTSPHQRQRSSTTGQARPRVGFSDHIEFIPRPLSTISSETSSSLSTIRPSHSVTGSISSVMSIGNTSSPSSKATRSPSLDEEIPVTTSSLDHEHLVQLPANPANTKTTESNSSASEVGPSWSERFSSQPSRDTQLDCSTKEEPANLLRLAGTPDTLRVRRRSIPRSNSPLARPRTSPEPKVAKRQRKVKSWAGSLLARKARHSTYEDAQDFQRPSTPPLRSVAPSDELLLDSLNFDEDTTCVIQTTPSPKVKPSSKQKESSYMASEVLDDSLVADECGIVLDLDAALESPRSTANGPTFEDVTGGRSVGGRRRMHSGGATGGFEGPGMHYHRRAESAPELAPVNRQVFGFSRLGSNSAMADVFEEDEEEDPVGEARNDDSRRSIAAQEVESDNVNNIGVAVTSNSHSDEGPSATTQSQASGIPDAESDGTASETCTTPSVRPVETSNDSDIVGPVDDNENRHTPMATRIAKEATYSPSFASSQFDARPVSAPMPFMLPAPSPAFATPEIYSSALSTPDFSHSSFEGPRLHTASSSITDRGTLSSFRGGDHGSDLRPSVDDVPSLTSSASMISAYPPRVSSSAPSRPSTDRPTSAIKVPAPRTRSANASKRASLVSFSNWVGGSHGSKSKLCIEESAQTGETEKSEKKKGHRISRLMRFWKSKEKLNSS